MHIQTVTAIADKIKIQNTLFAKNKQEITVANRVLGKFLITTAIIVFAFFILMTFIFDRSAVFLIPCIVIFLILTSVRLLILLCPQISITLLLYLLCGLLVLYSSYTYVQTTSNHVCIVALFFIFLLPSLMLDLTTRILFIETLYTAVYVISVDSRYSEMANCLGCAIIGVFMGEVLKKTRLENFELKRQSTIREQTDYLTGLQNRRMLFTTLGNLEKEKQNNLDTGIMLIDIDFFKQYNDTYGHQSGDNCLKKIGSCFQRFGKENNITFFRYGGEEFVGISKGLSEEKLKPIIKKLNNAVCDLQIPHMKNASGVETISIGFSFARSELEVNTLLTQADIALYKAKDNGRNCAVSYTPGLVAPQDCVPSFRTIPR